MIREYHITGMSCNSCIDKVSKALESLNGVEVIEVGLTSPHAKIDANESVSVDDINSALQRAGKYSITEEGAQAEALIPLPEIKKQSEAKPAFLKTYKPLFLIVTFIAGVSIVVQYPFTSFNWMTWMRHFMAGFFIVFSFFKFLNLRGFSSSYSMYDIIAARWFGWGYIYPFVELTLGLLYLTDVFPFTTNVITAIVLGISSIGVIQSNLSKRKIKCACLGDVFNLPMSTVTIIEDLTMVTMAVIMIIIR